MISRDFGIYVRRDFYEISVSDGPLSHARAHFRILRSISLSLRSSDPFPFFFFVLDFCMGERV